MKPDGGRRADAERNRRRLLVAATAALSRDPQASMAQIAEASGVTRTTVYRHFSTREALLEALLEAAVASADEALKAVLAEHGSDPARVIDDLALVILDAGDRYAFLRAHRDRLAGRVPPPEVDDALGRWLAVARVDGRVRPDVALAWQRRAILALATAATEALHDGELTAADARLALRTAFEALLLPPSRRGNL